MENLALRLPLHGRLMGYYEQGMEVVEAMLFPCAPGSDAQSTSPHDLLQLNQGDLLAITSNDGREIWRGVLPRRRFFGGISLPEGWERWFDDELPATLLSRDHVPFWRQGRCAPFYVTPNYLRPPHLRNP